MLQRLLVNDSRRKSIFPDKTDNKENVNSLVEEIIRIPYKRIEHLEKNKMNYEQEISNLNSSLLDKTQYIKVLEEKCEGPQESQDLQNDLLEFKAQNKLLNEEIEKLKVQLECLQEEIAVKNTKHRELELLFNNKNIPIKPSNELLDSLEGYIEKESDLKEDIKSKETEINNLKTQLSFLEEKMVELTKLSKEYEILKKEREQNLNEIKELLSEKDIITNDNEALTLDLERAESTIKHQITIIKTLEDDVNGKAEEICNLQFEIDNINSSKNLELQNCLKEKETAESTVQNQKVVIKTLEDDITFRTDEISNLQLQMESTNSTKVEFENCLKEKELVESTVQNQKVIIKSLEDDITVKSEEIITLQLQIESKKSIEISELETHLQQKDVEIKSLKDDYNNCLKQVEDLSIKISNFEDETGSLKKENIRLAEVQEKNLELANAAVERDEEIKKLKVDLDKITKENLDLEHCIEFSTSKIEELNKKVCILVDENDYLKKELNTLQEVNNSNNIELASVVDKDVQIKNLMDDVNEKLKMSQHLEEKMCSIASEVNELKKQVKDLTEENVELKLQNNKLEQECENEKSKENIELTNKVLNLVQQIDEIKAKHDVVMEKLNTEIERLAGEIDDKKSFIISLQSELESIKSTNEKQSLENDKLNKKVNEQIEEINEHNNVLQEITKEKAALIEDVEHKLSAINTLQNDIDLLKRKNDELITKISNLVQQIDEIRAEHINNVEKVDQINGYQMEDANIEMVKLTKDLENKKFLINTLQSELEQLKSGNDTKVAALQKQIDEINQEHGNVLQKLTNEKSKLAEEIETKQLEINRLKTEISSLRSIGKLQNLENNTKVESDQLIAENKYLTRKFKKEKSELEDIIMSKKLTIKSLEKELEILKCNDPLTSLQQEIASKNVELDELKKSFTNHSKELNAIQESNKVAQQEILKLKDFIFKKESEIEKLRNEVELLKNNDNELDSKILHLNKLAQDKDAVVTNCQENIRELENKIREKQKEISSLREELSCCQMSLENRNKNMYTMQGIINDLQTEKDQLHHDLQQLKQEKLEKQEESETKNKNQINHENTMQKYEETVKDLNKIKTEFYDIKQQLLSTKEENLRLKSDNQTIKDTYNNQLQEQIKANNKHKAKINDLTNQMEEFNKNCSVEINDVLNDCIIVCGKCKTKTNNLISKEIAKMGKCKCLIKMLIDTIAYCNDLLKKEKDGLKNAAVPNYYHQLYKTLMQQLDAETNSIKKFTSNISKYLPNEDLDSTMSSLWEGESSTFAKLQGELKTIKDCATYCMNQYKTLKDQCKEVGNYKMEIEKLKASEISLSKTIENLTSKLTFEQLQLRDARGELKLKEGELEKVTQKAMQLKKQYGDENAQYKAQLQAMRQEVAGIRKQGMY